MIKFTVSIYNYYNHTSVDYLVGGYTFSNSSGVCEWRAVTALGIGHLENGQYSNLPVTFGHDGDTCCIYIGSSAVVWRHPVIQIKDVLIGFTNHRFDNWNDGWGVSIISESDNTVTEVKIDNPNPIASAITVDGDDLIFEFL